MSHRDSIFSSFSPLVQAEHRIKREETTVFRGCKQRANHPLSHLKRRQCFTLIVVGMKDAFGVSRPAAVCLTSSSPSLSLARERPKKKKKKNIFLKPLNLTGDGIKLCPLKC